VWAWVNCSHVFFFTRAGGEAYLQDLPKAEMHRLEAGLALVGTSSQQLGRRI
jgi:hypothetical protein